MMWCGKCNMAIGDFDAVKKVESDCHTEVDDGRYEDFVTLRCPICGEELDDADLCTCGKHKPTYEDYCPSCTGSRDRIMKRAIAKAEEETGMSHNDAYDLLSRYFVG